MKISQTVLAGLVCCSLTASTANAAVVNFTGTINTAVGAYPVGNIGDAIAFSVTFNTVGGGGVAGAVTAATLSVGGESYNATGGTVTLINDAGGLIDILRVDVDLGNSAPGGLAGGEFDLALHAPIMTVGDTLLTQANVDAITANQLSSSNFGWQPVGTVVRNGSVAAVPEPSSIIMMAGLGLFFVGGAVRRRKKQNAEKLEAITV